ncbi:MAG: DUF4097 family beta strand repeat-containing protein [Oscillospiraceae bacterium]
MKNNRIYIIATISLIAGLAIFTGGFAMLNFDINKLTNQSEFEQKQYLSYEKSDKIIIDDYDINVRIFRSESENLEVSYYENNKQSYQIDESQGTIKIQKINTLKWYDYIFNISFVQCDLLIGVPKSFKGEIDCETSNAYISLNNISLESLNLKTSNNNILLENIEVNKSAQVNTSNGAIKLIKSEIGGEIICNTSNAKVELENVIAQNANIRTSNGRIRLENIECSENITVKNSNSSILLREVKFGEMLDCQTSNGNISGEIDGKISDYSIKSITSNGKSNLPEILNGGNKVLYVKTSNSDIDINFK